MKERKKIYTPTIGLEIHARITMPSKLICPASPTACVSYSYTDLGLPGALPIIAPSLPLEKLYFFATELGCSFASHIAFDRKHYFYPDSPLGYQITQFKSPIMQKGKVSLPGLDVGIIEAHLECDAGSLIHHSHGCSVDFSRCASALLEIVSQPHLHTSYEAVEYARYIYECLQYWDLCEGKIQAGQFRVDASVSVSDTQLLGQRVEIKNISSFTHLKTAIEYEIERQTELLFLGDKVLCETRGFDEQSCQTYSMREKEGYVDYRFIRDYDIPVIDTTSYLKTIKDSLPKSIDSSYLTSKLALCALFEDHQMHEAKKLTFEYLCTHPYKHFFKSLLKTRISKEHQKKLLQCLCYWLPAGVKVKHSPEELEFTFEQVLQIIHSDSCTTKEDFLKQLLPQESSQEIVDIAKVRVVLSQYIDKILSPKQDRVKMLSFLIGQCVKSGLTQTPLLRTEVEKQMQFLLLESNK